MGKIVTVVLSGLLILPMLCQAETFEEYQQELAHEEQPSLVPKGTQEPKLIPKDIIIQELSKPQPPGQVASIVFSSESILFDYGSWKIRDGSFRQLMEIASALKDPQLTSIPMFYVDGHTCSIGSEENNCRLSWRRADSVVKFLVEVGQVPVNKLEPRGFGKFCPMASNDTENGRATNRRVVLTSGTIPAAKDTASQCSGSYR